VAQCGDAVRIRFRAAKNDDGERWEEGCSKWPSDGFLVPGQEKEAFLDDRAETWRPSCDIKSRLGR
jgi:hypothetical protein